MTMLKKLAKLFGFSKVDYKGMVENGALVVDVRTPQEYAKGAVKESVNIPLFELSASLKALYGKQIVLVCRSGARASQAQVLLRDNGIEAFNAGPWQKMS